MDYANRKFLHHHNGVALVETPTPGDVRPGADETKPKHKKLGRRQSTLYMAWSVGPGSTSI